jgi:hypothetical protein
MAVATDVVGYLEGKQRTRRGGSEDNLAGPNDELVPQGVRVRQGAGGDQAGRRAARRRLQRPETHGRSPSIGTPEMPQVGYRAIPS